MWRGAKAFLCGGRAASPAPAPGLGSALLSLALALAPPLFAQSSYLAPDMAALEATYGGPKGRIAYQALTLRLQRGEELSGEEYRALYYGSAFQEHHQERDRSGTRDLAGLLAPGKAAQVLHRSDSILALRPADPTANYFKGLGLFLMDTNSAEAVRYRDRYARIMEAILSSGNGAGCGSAYVVLGQQDALETMRYLGIPGTTGAERDGDCQVFRIRSSPIYRARSIHFDLRWAAVDPQAVDGPSGKKKRDKN